MYNFTIVFLLLLLLFVVSGRSFVLKRSIDSTCYGYTHRDAAYDIVVGESDSIKVLSCCQIGDAMYVARWRRLRDDGKFDPISLCDGDSVDFACWKYYSRLYVRLFVNVSQLGDGGVSFLCGKEPLWNSDFSVTTKIALTLENPTLPVPPPSPRPAVKSRKFAFEIIKTGRHNNVSTCSGGDFDGSQANRVENRRDAKRRRILTCLGNSSQIVWRVQGKRETKGGGTIVKRCSRAESIKQPCSKSFSHGLHLYAATKISKSKKKIFQCLFRKFVDGEIARSTTLCRFKVAWK